MYSFSRFRDVSEFLCFSDRDVFCYEGGEGVGSFSCFAGYDRKRSCVFSVGNVHGGTRVLNLIVWSCSGRYLGSLGVYALAYVPEYRT